MSFSAVETNERFDEVCARYTEPLVGVLRSFGCLDQDARDVVQETLLAVWKHLAFIPRPAEWAYLRTAAIRKARNRHRDANAAMRGGGANVPLDLTSFRVADAAMTVEEQLIHDQELANFFRKFAAAMNELEEETRLCVVLRRRGLASKAIAAQLGLTDQAVRSRLSRANKHLRARLGEPPPGVDWLDAIGDDE